MLAYALYGVGIYFALGVIVTLFYVWTSWPLEWTGEEARYFLGIMLKWPLYVAFAVFIWLASRHR